MESLREDLMLTRELGRCGLVVIAMLALLTTATADEPATSRETIELHPPGGSAQAHSVSVSFDAVVYAKNGVGIEIGRSGKSQEETFIATMLDVYRAGTIDDVLNLWLPEERAGKRTFLDSDGGKTFRRSQDFHKSISRVELRAKVLYGNVILLGVVCNRGATLTTLVYPLVKRDGQYYMTDELSDDPVFGYLMDRVVPGLGHTTVPGK
jgi:hypothetical protein